MCSHSDLGEKTVSLASDIWLVAKYQKKIRRLYQAAIADMQ